MDGLEEVLRFVSEGSTSFGNVTLVTWTDDLSDGGR